MQPQLTGSNQSTYNDIFQYPLPRDMRWPDLHSLLGVLATVVKSADGSLQITRNGRNLFLPRPQRNVATAQDIMDIRRFLENSETTARSPMQGEREKSKTIGKNH